MTTRALAYASLTLRAQLEREHARRALVALAADDGARIRRHGSCERVSSREWRRARRHLQRSVDFAAAAAEVVEKEAP